jgi:hypothetical protein
MKKKVNAGKAINNAIPRIPKKYGTRKPRAKLATANGKM